MGATTVPKPTPRFARVTDRAGSERLFGRLSEIRVSGTPIRGPHWISSPVTDSLFHIAADRSRRALLCWMHFVTLRRLPCLCS